jgi:hypothetical protein
VFFLDASAALRCKTNLVAQPARESDKLKQKMPHAASRLAHTEKTNSLLFLPNILALKILQLISELQHINIWQLQSSNIF